MYQKSAENMKSIQAQGRVFAQCAQFNRCANALLARASAKPHVFGDDVLVSRNIYDAMLINKAGVKGVHIRQKPPQGLLEIVDRIGLHNIAGDMVEALRVERDEFQGWLAGRSVEYRTVLQALKDRDHDLKVIMSAVTGGDFVCEEPNFEYEDMEGFAQELHVDRWPKWSLVSAFCGEGTGYYPAKNFDQDDYERMMDIDGLSVDEVVALEGDVAKVWDVMLIKGLGGQDEDLSKGLVHHAPVGTRFAQLYQSVPFDLEMGA